MINLDSFRSLVSTTKNQEGGLMPQYNKGLKALSVLLSVLATLVACEGNETELFGVSVNASVTASACDGGEDQPDGCASQRFCLIHEDDAQVNGLDPDDLPCAEVDLSSGSADVQLKGLAKAGNYLPQFNGASFPTGMSAVTYRLNGVTVSNMLQFKRGDNTLVVNIMAEDSGGNGGSGGSGNGTGTGSVCLDGDANSASNDLSGSCVITVDGQVATPDADDDGLCPDGVLLTGLDAKTSSIGVVCEDENLAGDITTGVAEDAVTDVTVPLEDTTPGGTDVVPTTLCMTIGMSNGDAVAGGIDACEVKDSAVATPYTATTDPDGVCTGSDELFFTGVEAGEGKHITVKCGDLHELGIYNIDEEAYNTKKVRFSVPGNTGEPCYKDIGDNVNPFEVRRALQAKLGHFNVQGECIVEDDATADFANWSVVGLSDNASCTAVGEASCLVGPVGTATDVVDGYYGHLVWETTLTQLETLPEKGTVNYTVTLTDADGQSLSLVLVAVNDTVTGSP